MTFITTAWSTRPLTGWTCAPPMKFPILSKTKPVGE